MMRERATSECRSESRSGRGMFGDGSAMELGRPRMRLIQLFNDLEHDVCMGVKGSAYVSQKYKLQNVVWRCAVSSGLCPLPDLTLLCSPAAVAFLTAVPVCR